ncbi:MULTISPECIES: hypothetical protein [unclassified Microbacterium]|uniref:hypothetical protein n=1 Tax=unclassified Microbacterium TaxID=2609290 RepID=UPI00214BA938|nr:MULTISPECIES: hypothetical protein [unclassified Microbacterium]MCR2784423.1 hypothetical protein [Microbacterium sp. zg.B96]MDL5350668.1 hypothetical protein [Microbacterium sp. zg-YB36]WIM14761.1 hypothetical protein QNO11_09300 [Microbacterium sp. zg-B96]
MTSTPDEADRSALEELRAEIDALKQIPEEELVSPSPAKLNEDAPEPTPTDAPGSQDLDTTE